MTDIPTLGHSPAQATAMIPLCIARHEIASQMGPAIREVFSVLAAQGLKPAGPWFCYHRRFDPALFDFEVSVPVATPVIASGRVRPGLRPAAQVARTVMHGAYENLHSAWPALDAWVIDEGLAARGDFWEIYAIGPETSPDPANWRTELNRALLKREHGR